MLHEEELDRLAEAVAQRLLHHLADWPEGTLERHTAMRVGAAARLLGVSANTLRSWERRFGFPVPVRPHAADHGERAQRYYSPAQIVLLKQSLFRAGGDITAAFALLRADIEALEAGAGPRPHK